MVPSIPMLQRPLYRAETLSRLRTDQHSYGIIETAQGTGYHAPGSPGPRQGCKRR